MGSFVVGLDATVVNVALPAIEEELGGGLAGPAVGVQRLPARARGADPRRRLARRRLRRAARSSASASLGFGATSLVCALAPSIEVLVAGRVAQGVFGALLTPSALAVIVAAFPAEQRGGAVGRGRRGRGSRRSSARSSAASSSTRASWRWIFAINVPFVIATLVVVAMAVPKRPRAHGAPAGRLAGRRAVVPRPRGADARAHPPAASGWGAPDVVIPGARAACCSSASSSSRESTHGAPDAPARALQAAQLRRRQRADVRDVRGPLDAVLLPRPVPPAGRGLHGARGRPRDAADDDRHVRALQARGHARRPPRPAPVHGRRAAPRRRRPRSCSLRVDADVDYVDGAAAGAARLLARPDGDRRAADRDRAGRRRRGARGHRVGRQQRDRARGRAARRRGARRGRRRAVHERAARAGRRLGAVGRAGRRSSRNAEDRVLARADVSGLAPAEAATVARATEAASVRAFHVGMAISAALVALGGSSASRSCATRAARSRARAARAASSRAPRPTPRASAPPVAGARHARSAAS